MPKNPLLSFIIVNYKQCQLTIRCVNSILEFGDNEKIIIIDNSETNTEILSLQQEFINRTSTIIAETPSENELVNHRIIIIPSQNKGFAAANNVGLHAFFDFNLSSYAWLLNNDAFLHKDSIAKLKKHLCADNPLVSGTALLYASCPSMVQACGGTINLKTMKTNHLYEGSTIPEVPLTVMADYPIGASMIISSDFIRERGYMNERYFLYFEEADWLLPIIKAGIKTKIYSDVLVFHEVGFSIGTNSKRNRKTRPMADYYFFRSKIWFSQSVGYIPYLLTLMSIPLYCLKRIYRLQFKSIQVIIKAFFDSLKSNSHLSGVQ